jgi:AraC-like DNA-binding protein
LGLTLSWTVRTIYATNTDMLDRSSEISTTARPPLDPLNDLLAGMRLTGVEYRRIELSPPFGLGFGASEGRANFHFVARGAVFLRQGDEVHQMDAGDAVLLPRGGRHDVVSEPDLGASDVAAFPTSTICHGVSALTACKVGDCPSSHVLIFSGCMEFDLGGMGSLLGLMPEAMFVGTLSERYPEILPILDAMERETCGGRAGFAGILAHLANVVAAFIVRAWVESGCGDASGWVSALRDPRLGGVISAVHRDPGRDWTVADLAAEMGSSRSIFAERFLAVTGLTPLRYLTELRMRLAAEWIGRDRMPIDVAAHRLGYGSQAAFSRAFKRINGHSPGSIRSAPRSA